MYRVCREIRFCYGHRLLNYEGPCRHLHGHNAKAEIYLAGESLNGRDFLCDFGELKNIVKEWIDRTLDHKMLLRKDDPLVNLLREKGEPVVIFDTNPTAEAIARRIFEFVVDRKFPVEQVRVWENDSAWASYSL